MELIAGGWIRVLHTLDVTWKCNEPYWLCFPFKWKYSLAAVTAAAPLVILLLDFFLLLAAFQFSLRFFLYALFNSNYIFVLVNICFRNCINRPILKRLGSWNLSHSSLLPRFRSEFQATTFFILARIESLVFESSLKVSQCWCNLEFQNEHEIHAFFICKKFFSLALLYSVFQSKQTGSNVMVKYWVSVRTVRCLFQMRMNNEMKIEL